MEDEKKELSPQEKAVKQIEEWADWLEINKFTDDFKEAIDTLLVPVMNERLAFNEESESFKLKLIRPIEMENKKVELVDVHEVVISELKGVQKYKDSEKIDAAELVLAKSCGISLAEASKLGKRDIAVLNCLNQVFFG